MLSKELLKKIKRLEIVTKRTVDSLMGGEYHSVFKGQGIHFSDFREYLPGDDIRNIAWKVSARTNQTHVKTFEEERELNVFMLVDLSSSQIYSSSNSRKIDLVSELASLISYSAIFNKDRIGMLSFAEDINEFVPPKKGKKHILSLITKILQDKKVGNSTNIINALGFMSKVLKKKSVIFIISDFIFDTDVSNILKKLAMKHDIIALWVYDKFEYEIPNLGLLSIKDPENGKEILVDSSSPSFKNNYLNNIKNYVNKTVELFKTSKIDYLKISTQDDYANALLSYFKLRKKKK